MSRPARPFWSFVNKTETCWLWEGSKNREGYGLLRRVNETPRVKLAHRLAYEELIGPIPDGLVIDHLCRVTNCVNPAHMEPVTDRVNIMRGEGLAVQNAAKTHCIRGHVLPESRNRYGRRVCKPCLTVYQRLYARNCYRRDHPNAKWRVLDVEVQAAVLWQKRGRVA
jgi:hypothetical protein